MTGVVARRLVEARSIRGLQAQHVADRAGISAPYLSNLESGRVLPNSDLLPRLADALDVDVDWIVGRTREPRSTSEKACRLASRISALSEADRRLAELWLDTLAAGRRGADPNADLRLRRRIEAARARTD